MKFAKVVEVFDGIQGEGIYAGVRQIMVRLSGCNLNCAYCDTEDAKTGMGKMVSDSELIGFILTLKTRAKTTFHSVSFTGGEPLLQASFLKSFFACIVKKGFKIYLETNGTLPENFRPLLPFVSYVAMDIKLESSTRQNVNWDNHLKFLKIASKKNSFVKVVVTGETTEDEIADAVETVALVDKSIPFVLQPVTPLKKKVPGVKIDGLQTFYCVARRVLSSVLIIPQLHRTLPHQGVFCIFNQAEYKKMKD